MEFKHKVRVVVPSTQNVTDSIDNTEYVKKVAARLSQLFGGATSRECEGYWVSDTAGLVVEAVKEVEAFAVELSDEDIQEVVKLAVDLKEELHQEAVMYEIDGVAYLTD